MGLSTLVKLWTIFSNVGVTEEYSQLKIKGIRLTNQFSISIFLVSMPFAPLMVFAGQTYFGVFIIFCSFSFLIPILINWRKYHILAKVWFIIYDYLIIYILCLFLGKESGMYLAFYSSCFLPFLFFEKKNTFSTILLSLTPAVLALCAWWEIGAMWIPRIELNTTFIELYHTSMIIAVFMVTFGSISIFLSDIILHFKELESVIQHKEITEKKLEIALQDAAATSQAKTQFLANMSHEIRTPMNAIMGFSKLLMRQKEKLNAQQWEFINNINVSGQRLLDTINNILDLTKIESGKVLVHEENFDLSTLIQEVYQINQIHAEEKQIHFHYFLSPDVPRFVRCDRQILGQILINLISNALKYTSQGGTVEMKVESKNRFLILKVEDNGIGIPEDKQTIIFNPFEQVDNSLTRNFEGTGLGLTLVKKLTELLKGRVELKSKVGKGTKFTIEIPLITAEFADQKEQSVSISQNKFNPNEVVLMAEDNVLNQEVSKAIFAEMGLQLHIAQNGQEAVEKAIELNPNLILMDFHMPVMDGIEATLQLKQIEKMRQIPVVFLSADIFDEQKKKASDIGIHEYLTKPLELDTLLPILQKYLNPPQNTVN